VKYEGLNPTGSFKDRGMTMLSPSGRGGSRAIIWCLTGNTSAAGAPMRRAAGITALC